MLTKKQEDFAQAVAAGKSGAEAYRESYNAKDMLDTTVWKRASELLHHGKVAGRIKELRERVSMKNLWTREMSVKALVQAYKEGRPSEKVAAIKELNAMHGYRKPQEISVQGNLDVIQRRIIDDVSDD